VRCGGDRILAGDHRGNWLQQRQQLEQRLHFEQRQLEREHLRLDEREHLRQLVGVDEQLRVERR